MRYAIGLLHQNYNSSLIVYITISFPILLKDTSVSSATTCSVVSFDFLHGGLKKICHIKVFVRHFNVVYRHFSQLRVYLIYLIAKCWISKTQRDLAQIYIQTNGLSVHELVNTENSSLLLLKILEYLS